MLPWSGGLATDSLSSSIGNVRKLLFRLRHTVSLFMFLVCFPTSTREQLDSVYRFGDSSLVQTPTVMLLDFNLFSSTSPCVHATSLEISRVVLVCCKVASFSAHARSSVSCAPVACCHLFLVCQFCIRRDMCTHHAAYRDLHNPSPPTNLLGPSSKGLSMFDYTSVICKRITTAPADLQRPSHPQRTRPCFRILHHSTPLPLGFFFTVSFPTPTIPPPPLCSLPVTVSLRLNFLHTSLATLSSHSSSLSSNCQEKTWPSPLTSSSPLLSLPALLISLSSHLSVFLLHSSDHSDSSFS